jgi:regulator of sirC expression with transglutaminase-like and TPR domain
MDAVIAGLEFAELVKRCDELGAQPALDRACLLISAVFDPSADVERSLARLDDIAEIASIRASGATDSYANASALLDAVFNASGFRGNASAYDDPRNSMLSSVLDRRTGIPITLSIVVMEVARRIGLPLDGVGLPGHFVVKFPDSTSRLFIDAFDGGRILEAMDCVALVERQTGGRITWTDDFLEPVAPRAILKRVLVNLKNALSHAKNYPSALTAIELQLTLDPWDPTELRDRGILFARLHRYDRAIADLEAYLERSPDASDVKQIRDTVLRYLREARNL